MLRIYSQNGNNNAQEQTLIETALPSVLLLWPTTQKQPKCINFPSYFRGKYWTRRNRRLGEL